MRYNRLKVITNYFNKPIIKIILYILGIGILLFVIKTVNDCSTYGEAVLSILRNDTTITVFVLAIITLVYKSLIYWINKNIEESEKTETDHRKIIRQYSGHAKESASEFNELGVYLKVCQPNLDIGKKLNNPVKDKYSKDYNAWNKEYEASNFQSQNACSDAFLTLASLSMYTNTSKSTLKGIDFVDTDTRYTLPNYIQINSQGLLRAHSTTSLKNNETTIRLTDAGFSCGKLILSTQRSTYYEMLMTNRCMDYEHCPNMTLRQIYEYKSRISKLNDSKLSNQIGINGLIITSDDYFLIEKRDLSKSTWKDKFSQPISLAMKRINIKEEFLNNGVIKKSDNIAVEIFKDIIYKTIYDNYSIREEDIREDFSIKNNFLGLARDLLEGGKPNLYFFVKLNITAEDLKKRMEQHARIDQENDFGMKPLSNSKLKSEFYLVHKDKVKIDYNYAMSLRRKDRKNKHNNKGWIYINRINFPRSGRIKSIGHRIKRRLYWSLRFKYRKECSEAFLVCLAYIQLCKNVFEFGDDE